MDLSFLSPSNFLKGITDFLKNGTKAGPLDSNRGSRQAAKASFRFTPEQSQSANLSLIEAQNFSHDIFLNSNFGRSIGRSFRQGVLGDGLKLRSEVRNKTADKNGVHKPKDIVNKRIQRDWAKWGRAVSRCGQLSWHELCRLVLSTMIESGEVFIRLYDIAPENLSKGVKKRGGIPLTLEVLEGDMVDEKKTNIVDEAGNYWIQGIKFSPDGHPLAYAFRVMVNGNYETREFPSSNVLHLFMRDEQRPSTRRGWPWVTASRHLTDQADAFVKAQLIHAQNSAAPNAYVIQAPESQAVAPTEEADYSGIEELPSAAGTTVRLPHGSTVVEPKQIVAGGLEPYLVATQQLVAMGIGVTSDELSLDSSRQNFSGLRAGGIKNAGRFSEIRSFITENFYDVVYRVWWLPRYLLTVKEKDWSIDPDDYPFSWSYKHPPYIEPVKQLEAHQKAYELGIVSKSTVAHDMNLDFESEQQRRMLDFKIEEVNRPPSNNRATNTVAPNNSVPNNNTNDESNNNNNQV